MGCGQKIAPVSWCYGGPRAGSTQVLVPDANRRRALFLSTGEVVFKHSKLALAAIVAISGSAVVAQTQPATPPAQPQQLERVEVTGSNIKRLNAETVAPVEIITRDQIERTGQPTAADVLRALPINTGSFGESFSNSFAPGAAGISLRGLGQKTTLVLLNGRRIAGYGFAQNLQDTFVDLNAIPSSAIERVEILKDGASAIYGSDAIAGVVNIILRKDYKGFEATANAGFFEGKSDARGSLAFGMGDRAADGYNVFAAFDFFKRDQVLQSDTEYLKTRDFRGRPGGRNFQSLTAGGTWRQTGPAVVSGGVFQGNALTNNYRAISECAGTVMTGPQAVAAGLIDTTGGANAALASANNTFCTLDQNSQLPALPGTTRLNLLSRATFDLSANATAYAEVGLSRVETEQEFTTGFYASTALNPTPQGLRPYTFNLTFAPGVAGNPFTTNFARYTGNLVDTGNRKNFIQSDNARVLLGANYTLADWDLDSGVTFSRSDTYSRNFNRIGKAGVGSVFNVATGPFTPASAFPIVTNTQYSLDRPSTNSAALRDLLTEDFDRTALSELVAVDTKASTTIGRLDGGDAGLALGGEFRREKIVDRPAAIAASGGIIAQGITATNQSRSNASVFAEVVLPFTKQLEVQGALRFDRYSDYGSSTTPKLGALYRVNDQVLVRANYSKGFRAPTLPEISPSVATYFTTVFDPEVNNFVSISGVALGNTQLKAEKSTSNTVGIVFNPSRDLDLGLNWYKIDWRNVVVIASLQDVIDASCPAGAPPCPSTANVVRDPVTNALQIVYSQYENQAKRVTSGFDLDGTVRFTNDLGRFALNGTVTYIHSFKEDGTEYVGTNGGNSTLPRTRGSASLNFDNGPWSLTGRVNYTHSYYQQSVAASYFTNRDPRFQTGVLPDRVGSNTTVDLFARYRFNSNLTASLSVQNVMNKMPPYDPAWTNLTDISLYSVIGRTIRVGLQYKM